MTALPQGWRQIAHASLDSTNSALKRLIEAGGTAEIALHEGLIVTAERQTAGRGRQGRSWESPAGNLYASFLIDAPEPMARAPELGFVAAVAVIDALGPLGVELRCKWPNDVLASGAKLAGILPELCGAWVVLGIGLNLVPVAVDSTYPVTCLAEEGVELTPDAALTRVTTALQQRLTQWRHDGFPAIAAAWSAVGPVPGAALTIKLPGGVPPVEGRFAGLDPDGALRLTTDGGPRRILAGDVLFAPVRARETA